MAKTKSILELRGTIEGLTFVKSRAYGEHVRAARGTYKKAVMNKACQKTSKELLKANKPAKILNDAIARYREDFRGGFLWQRIVSMFKKQLKKKGRFDFGQLSEFEVHEKLPLTRIFNPDVKISIDETKGVLILSVSSDNQPTFGGRYIDGYRLRAIAIFPDEKK